MQLLDGGGTIVLAKKDDDQGMEPAVSPANMVSELGPSVDIDALDDWHCKGGVEKYEPQGFILREFSSLSSLKARLKLSIDLLLSKESGIWPSYK